MWSGGRACSHLRGLFLVLWVGAGRWEPFLRHLSPEGEETRELVHSLLPVPRGGGGAGPSSGEE